MNQRTEAKNQVCNVLAPAAPRNDFSGEIDLLALGRSLWAQRWVVVGATAFAILLSGCYLMLATPMYRTQVILRPVYAQSFDRLNATGLYALNSEQALAQAGVELESYSNRLAFFREYPGLFGVLPGSSSSLGGEFEAFNAKAFKMLYPNKKDFMHGTYVGMQIEYPEGMDGAAILNNLTARVLSNMSKRVAEELGVLIENRTEQLMRDIEVAKVRYQVQVDAEVAKLKEGDTTRRHVLEDELAALRLELKSRRINRIAVLDEAVRIARKLGIRKPMTPSALSQESSEKSVIRTEIHNQQLPLFFMGMDALMAEREVLMARESDDFTEPRVAEIVKELELLRNNRWVESLQARGDSELFIEDIGKMQSERARLEGLKLDLDGLQLVQVDQPAVQPAQPFKPRTLLVLSLGVLLGAMLGVFVALLRSFTLKKD